MQPYGHIFLQLSCCFAKVNAEYQLKHRLYCQTYSIYYKGVIVQYIVKAFVLAVIFISCAVQYCEKSIDIYHVVI